MANILRDKKAGEFIVKICDGCGEFECAEIEMTTENGCSCTKYDGNGAIIAREFGIVRNYNGQQFWALLECFVESIENSKSLS